MTLSSQISAVPLLYPIGTKVVCLKVSLSGYDFSGVFNPKQVENIYQFFSLNIGNSSISFDQMYVPNCPPPNIHGDSYFIFCKPEDVKAAYGWLQHGWTNHLRLKRALAEHALEQINKFEDKQKEIAGQKFNLLGDSFSLKESSYESIWACLANIAKERTTINYLVTSSDKKDVTISDLFTPF